mgnify:CR=1 FL=1
MTNPTPTADAGAVPCPETGKPLYRTILQDEPPPWVRDGVRVKVKTTPSTRLRSRGSNGLPVRVPSYGDKKDNAAWAGEVGTVELDIMPHKTEAEVQAVLRDYLAEQLRGEPLLPGVDALDAGDWLARMGLSFILAGGRWDLSDRASVRQLVRGELLVSILQPEALSA